MITGKETFLQALIEAFLMEKGTNEFYLSASEKLLNQEVKETFSKLAVWEHRHMEYIQFLYQSFQGDTDMISFDQFSRKTPAHFVEGGIPIKNLLEKTAAQKIESDWNALSLAFEIEGKAYGLYRRLSETAEDSSARVFMKEMMEQEEKHIQYLRKMREKLAQAS